MQAETKKPFIISCVLHGLFFFVILVALLLQTCTKPKETLHVFTLVSESQTIPNKPPTAQLPEIALKIPSAKERPIVQPKPIAPKPELVQKMSYAEFIKKKGAPKPRPARQTVPKQVSVPNLNVSQLTAQLEQVLVHDASGKTVQARFPLDYSALNAYIAKVREQLDDAWQKPEKLAVLHPEATVEFSVEANGHLSGVRIVQGSGNADFDNSVLKAFSRTNNLGTPPEAHRYTLRLTFKMLDN